MASRYPHSTFCESHFPQSCWVHVGYKTSPAGYIWWIGKDPGYKLSQSGSPRSVERSIQACEQSPRSSPGQRYPAGSEMAFFWPEAQSVRGIKPTEREKWCPESRAPCMGNYAVSCYVAISCIWILENISPVILCFTKSCLNGFLIPAKDTLIKTISKRRFPETLRGSHKFTETLWLYQDWVMLWTLHKAHAQ